MKFRGTSATLAVMLSGALLLGACTSEEPTTTADPTTSSTGDATTAQTEPTATDSTSPSGDTPAACLQDVGITETKDGQVSFTAGPGDWSGYNGVTSKTYTTYNSAIGGQMFSGFVYFGTDGTICENKDFGTMEVLSEDPLELKYTISDKAVWSDGTPITINDYLLDYASQNPEWLVPGLVNGKDPNAKAVFDAVGSTFAQYIPDGPQGEVGSKTFTVKYDVPNPDYKLTITSALPMHVAAKKSGMTAEELAKAILAKDAETVKKVATFWNTGWLYNAGELPDPAETPSSGPYMLKPGGWTAKQSITLTANDKYWGKPAATKDMIFRFIEDAQMAQALQNGDVMAIGPQPTGDTAKQLQAIGDSVTVGTYATLTWEHLDFNFIDKDGEFTYKETDADGNETGKDITLKTKASVFSDKMGGLALREAFALCVPRQGIVDNIIKPIDPGAQIMNAREVFPFQDNYKAVTEVSYDGRYDAVDIEKSKAKVAESGVKTPIDVRLGYRAGNQRRADTVAAIAASCKDAGFNVIDAASPDFFGVELPAGDYEVALFAWAGSGQIASGENIYSTNKPQNQQKYSNAKVDAAWKTLSSTLDENVQLEQTKIIEKELWDTLQGIPLYAHPGLAAWDSRIENVRTMAGQDGLSWNASQWAMK